MLTSRIGVNGPLSWISTQSVSLKTGPDQTKRDDASRPSVCSGTDLI